MRSRSAGRVYLESIGCKLNQCERDMLAAQFTAAGYDVVPDPAEADVCVVNSCAVTRVAAGKSRRRFRALRRINPAARLVATGCYAELVLSQRKCKEATSGDLCADLIVSNEQKKELVYLVEDQADRREQTGPAHPAGDRNGSLGAIRRTDVVQRPDEVWLSPAWRESADAPRPPRVVRPRTRPLVKIQDGCDSACTYCIVHRLRGPQRSRPRDDILAEVVALSRQGYREIVLTGVHLGAYGRDGESAPQGGTSAGSSLTALLSDLLAALPSNVRLRLSSIEPWGPMQDVGLRPDFLALWQDRRLCRHLHLPLQSGDDATLRRMGRHYGTEQYATWINQARSAIPGLAISTDVIAGFPGETVQEHEATVAFVQRAQFARLHVFPYSARPGTPAAEMDGQVSAEERQRRAAQLREVGTRSAAAFRRQFVGHTLAVLWETRPTAGFWTGLTDNYIRVSARSEQDLANRLCLAYLCDLEPGGMRGQLVDGSAS